MNKDKVSFFLISMFSICFLLISFKVVAQTKVVVIPMAGDDVIIEVEVEPTQKHIFLTSIQLQGDLSGVAGADALCQSESDSAGSLVQGKNFKAWISDPMANNINEIGTDGRFMSRHDLPYVLVDGSVVASSFPDLLDGAIDNPINIDQKGTTHVPQTVWTGISSNGDYSSTQNCGGWTSDDSGPTGLAGITSFTGPDWSGNGGAATCNGYLRLYCFEQ